MTDVWLRGLWLGPRTSLSPSSRYVGVSRPPCQRSWSVWCVTRHYQDPFHSLRRQAQEHIT
jgi:hypothetical protein